MPADNARNHIPAFYHNLPVTLTPYRTTGEYAYGLKVESDNFFTGGAATKSNLLHVEGSRPSGSAATGDSYDALIRCAGSNYAANAATFTWRGINGQVNNRSGGTLGRMDHNLGVQNKSGGTCPTLVGLTVTAENYGVTATEFGGIDVVLKNEGAGGVASREYGVHVRNLQASFATAVNSAFLATDTGANTGWNFGFDLYGASIVKAALRDANEVCFLSGAGVPTNGTTGAAFAEIGSIYADLTNGKLYVNGGTKASPTWKIVTSAS